MITRFPRCVRFWQTLPAALGLLAALPAGALAQHTPDPYNIVGEYNLQYEPFMYATPPNDLSALPNQGSLAPPAGNRSANRFQTYMDNVEMGDTVETSRSGDSRHTGPGVPYWRARGRFDDDPYRNSYRPNENADQSYYDNQKKLNKIYTKAMDEKDPKKRAEVLREYNLENLRAARKLSSGRNGAERPKDRATDRDNTNASRLPMRPGDPSNFNPRRLSTMPLSGISGPSGSLLPKRDRTIAPSPLGDSSRRNSTLGRGLTPSARDSRARGGANGLERSPTDILRRSESMDASEAKGGSAGSTDSASPFAPSPAPR